MNVSIECKWGMLVSKFNLKRKINYLNLIDKDIFKFLLLNSLLNFLLNCIFPISLHLLLHFTIFFLFMQFKTKHVLVILIWYLSLIRAKNINIYCIFLVRVISSHRLSSRHRLCHSTTVKVYSLLFLTILSSSFRSSYEKK